MPSHSLWQIKFDLIETGLYQWCFEAAAFHMNICSNSGSQDVYPGVDAQLDSSRAWLACGLALVALFTAFGLAYSYGVFFTAIVIEFDAGSGQGALFFSITSLLFFGLGCITGPLCDQIGPRPLLLAGGVLISAGLWLTAHAQTLATAYASYGIGVGIGVSCIFVPVVSAVGQWFEARRTLALGITVTGIGLGTLAFAPLSAVLIDAHGWRNTYKLYAVAGMFALVLCGVLFPRPPLSAVDNEYSGGRRFEQLRSHQYLHLYVATLLLNLALYVPFVHLPRAAQAAGITQLGAAGLIGALGIASVVGRLFIGALGNRYGQLGLYKLCFAMIGFSFFIWALAGSYTMFMVFALVVGLGYGGYIALTPAVLATVFGAGNLGRMLGVIYTAVALGAASGPLIVGAGIELLHGYTPVLIMLAGVSLLALLPLRALSQA